MMLTVDECSRDGRAWAKSLGSINEIDGKRIGSMIAKSYSDLWKKK